MGPSLLVCSPKVTSSGARSSNQRAELSTPPNLSPSFLAPWGQGCCKAQVQAALGPVRESSTGQGNFKFSAVLTGSQKLPAESQYGSELTYSAIHPGSLGCGACPARHVVNNQKAFKAATVVTFQVTDRLTPPPSSDPGSR